MASVNVHKLHFLGFSRPGFGPTVILGHGEKTARWLSGFILAKLLCKTGANTFCKHSLQNMLCKHTDHFPFFPLYKHSCTIFTQQNAKLCRLHHVSILLIHLITTAAIIFNVIKTWAIMMTVFIMISYQNPHHYFAKRSLAQFSLTLIHSPSPSLQLSIQSDARVRFVNAHYPFISKKATIGQ